MVDPNDGASVKIPFIMLPSKDEDAEAVKGFESKLTAPHEIVSFNDQIHVSCRSILYKTCSIADKTQGAKTSQLGIHGRSRRSQ
jgi:hypothetical protein